MSVVVDASVAATWFFEDEASTGTDILLRQVLDEGAWVPPLWAYEVANILIVAERRGRLSQSQVARALTLLDQLPIHVTADQAGRSSLLAMARQANLTAYDAAYLILAEGLGLPLATLDKDLARAARAAGVTTLPK
jgi:predicted nucleic acid-binding protein